MRRITLIFFIELLCAMNFVQAEPYELNSERIKEIYQDIPRLSNGLIVDSIGLFPIKTTVVDGRLQDVGVEIGNLMIDDLEIKAFVERKILELLLASTPYEVGLVLGHSKCQLRFNGADYVNGPLWDLEDGFEVLRSCTKVSCLSDDSLFYLDVENDKGDRLGLVFPINIQVITDKNKMELESEFLQALNSNYDIDIYARPSAKSIYYQIGDVYVHSQDYLHSEEVNDGTYYFYRGGQYEPIFSADYQIESFTNLFHFATDVTRNIDLHMIHRVYGNQTRVFTVSLDKLIAYCQANHLDVYVGIEGSEGDVLESSILLQNKRLKYLHLLHVKSDISTLFSRAKGGEQKGDMSVELYTYIPTDNVKDLYNDDSYKRRYNKFEIIN